MPVLSDTEIDNLLTTIGGGRKVTVDPGGLNEVPDLPVKLDDAAGKQDLGSGEIVAVRAQFLIRGSAIEGKVVGGHQNGTQLRDETTAIVYRAVEVLHDGIYARILLTKV